MSFTPRQQGMYRPLVEQAWEESCRISGCNPDADGARESWYRRQLIEVIGVPSTKHANKTVDFDILMFHFAEIAGDDQQIAYWCSAAERRMRHVIGQKMKELSGIMGKPVGWNYVTSILDHMHFPDDLQNCPADLLKKAMIALDIHIRRICRQSDNRARHVA